MAKRIPYGSKKYKEMRKRIFSRDHGKCQSPHCQNQPDWSLKDKKWCIDHIVPLSKGGNNDDSNLRVLCEFCHLVRDDRCFPPHGWNSHEKLGKKYVKTGRVKQSDLDKYRWQG